MIKEVGRSRRERDAPAHSFVYFVPFSFFSLTLEKSLLVMRMMMMMMAWFGWWWWWWPWPWRTLTRVGAGYA
jgi:hypothetical protein